MEKKKNSHIARLLAVLALVGTILIVFVAVSGVTGGDDDSGKKANPAKQRNVNKPKTKAKTYEVEEGDTLTTISRKTGISVQRLQKLNPDVDPQALQLGQEIKLR